MVAHERHKALSQWHKDNPAVAIRMDKETKDELTAYQKMEKHLSLSAAVRELIEIGMESVKLSKQSGKT